MNSYNIPGTVLKKSFYILLLAVLIFQGLGINGLAAPADSQFRFQQGDNPLQSLTCSLPGPEQTPTICNIQIVLMIDDSGSMTTNDPQTSRQEGLRNQGAKHVVDVLAASYYLPAIQLIDELNQNPDLEQKLPYPVVQVAVIHFSRGVKNTNVQWMKIDPVSPEAWNEDPIGQKKAIYDLIDQQYARLYQLTSFVEPFETARDLFEYSKPSGDCTRRSIMLFTDGAPEDAGGRLTGDALTNQMNELGRIAGEIQGNLPEEQKVEIYVTGFNKSPTYLDYWRDNVQPLWWNSVIGIEQAEGENETEPRHIKLLEGEDYLIQLPNRMEEITAKLAGLQREAVGESSINVPKHVQTLRFTLFNLDPTATLEITANGLPVIADGTDVVTSREVPSIEVWELNNPTAGSYQVTATEPGGSVTALLTYQNLTVEFNPEPARLQASTPSDLKFKVLDSAGEVVLPNEDPGLELKVEVTQNNRTQPLEWALDGDEYQASWTPSVEGDAEFRVEANLVDNENNVLLNCSGTVGTLPVDPAPLPPPTLAIGVPAPSCIPPGEVITVPVRLDFAGEDRSWANSLDWDVSATADGKSVPAVIEPVEVNTGEYQVTIDPVDAGEIQLSVRADAVIDGQAVTIPAGAPLTISMMVCTITDSFPIWLIFIWLLMGLFILFLGWVFLFGVNINIKIGILAVLEIILAVVWFILFDAYRMYLLWLLVLFAILLLLLFFIKRWEIKDGDLWWLIAVLTLYGLIWFVVFGGFPFWLFLLLLVMWLGILIAAWMIWREGSPQIPWLLILLLLVLAVVIIMYFSAYWLFLLFWLLVTLVLILVILVTGPFLLGRTVYITSDPLTLIEGIGLKVEEILNENGIHTFKQLAEADIDDLNRWLNERGGVYKAMDPKTWPEQAELAEKAKTSGNWDRFMKRINFLKDGIAPDEYHLSEKERKPPAKRKKPK